jgi:hypothetical protein
MIASRRYRCGDARIPDQMHHFLSKIPNPRLKVAVLTAYYLIIIAAVIYVQLRANFTTPPFIYQTF